MILRPDGSEVHETDATGPCRRCGEAWLPMPGEELKRRGGAGFFTGG